MIWPYRLLIYLFLFVMWIIEYLIRLAIGQAHAGEFFCAIRGGRSGWVVHDSSGTEEFLERAL